MIQKESSNSSQISAALYNAKPSALEIIRGGMLMVLRWVLVIPAAFLSYEIRGLTKAPWRLSTDTNSGASSTSGTQVSEAGIVVANHPNALFDLILCLAGAPRWAFFLHERSRTRIPVFNQMVKILRGVGVVRRQSADGKAETNEDVVNEKQRRTHRKLVRLLAEKNWLIIFPQGRSAEQVIPVESTLSDESYVQSLVPPLKNGFALTALDAAAATGWSRPVWIYPLGFSYEDVRYIGTRCHAVWAKPFDIREYQSEYELHREQAALAVCQRTHELITGAVATARHQILSLTRVGELQDESYSGAEPTRSASGGVIGSALIGLFLIVGLPFRLYGKLAARRTTEEAAHSFALWLMCSLIAIFIGGWHYFAMFCFVSVVATRTFVIIRRSFAMNARS